MMDTHRRLLLVMNDECYPIRAPLEPMEGARNLVGSYPADKRQ